MKLFHIGDILSVTTGKLLSPDGIGGLYSIPSCSLSLLLGPFIRRRYRTPNRWDWQIHLIIYLAALAIYVLSIYLSR